MRLILSVFGHLLDVSLDRVDAEDVVADEPDTQAATGHLEPVRSTPAGLGFTSPACDYEYPDD